MNKEVNIIEKSLGKLQIYVKPKEKVDAENFVHSLKSRTLYRELVKFAKEDNLMNASVFQTHHGYSMHGKVATAHIEIPNQDLYLCIELIDEKTKLEDYCRKHAAHLKNKMVVYRPVEFWAII